MSAHLALRPYQREAIDAVRKTWRSGTNRPAIILPTGCHRAGQHVLMFDGRTKGVEDVQVGDLLMGPDSTPREVLALARGTGPMLEIRPVKGEPWVVNDEHVLTLVETTQKSANTYPSWCTGGTVRDVPLPDWQGWAKWRKHIHKLFRVGVEFPPREAPPLDPYFLGVVLGDGSLSEPSRLSIATADPEIAQLCSDIAAHYGLKVRTDGRNGIQHHLTGGRRRNGPRGGSNPLLTALQGLGLLPIACENRFVPEDYRLGSRQVRLEILAGLLDSDGALSGGGFDYGSKSERLAGDVAFLARSLGLAAYVTKRINGHYRVSISGDCSVIPTRIPRKRAPSRAQKKDHLRTGFTVTPTGTAEPYYGFTLDGDQRYLLDDFTVTHNSGKTVVSSHLIEEESAHNGGRTLFLAHREELVDQAAEKILAVTSGLRVGIEMANRKADLSCDVVVGSVPTLASARRIAKWPRDAFRRVIVDECHHSASKTYMSVLDHFRCFADGGTSTLGITATLARGDGVGLGGVWQTVAYERSLLEMICEGYLVNPRGRRVEVDLDFSQVRTKGGDYVASELGEALTEAGFEREVVEAYQRHGGGRPGLVFTPTVATAQSVAEALCAAGVKAQAVWGEMDRAARAAAIEGLRNGELDLLCNCAVLTEGTDIPRAEIAIMARPTKSKGFYIQMAGRVLRLFPGKEDALILDLVGSTEDHRLCTLIDLADGEVKEKPKKKPEEDEQQELLDGEDLVGAVERIRKAKVRVSAVDVNLFASTSKVTWLQTRAGIWFIPAADGQVFVRESSYKPGTWAIGGMPRTGDPVPFGGAPDLTLAMALGEEHAARVERDGKTRFSRKGAQWRDREPKTEQLQAAERWGVQVSPGATAGQVSDLISVEIATSRIDRHFARQTARPLRLPTRPGEQQAPRVPVRTAG